MKVATSAIMGGIQGLLVGGIPGMFAGMALGAAVGALAMLAPTPKGATSKTVDEIFSSSTAAKPVPVLFGRGRLAGNYIAVGTFLRIKDKLKGTPGRRLYILNGVLGLAEGPLTAIGNFYLDRRTQDELRKPEKMPFSKYLIETTFGTSTESVNALVLDTGNGYPAPLVPWRNTAKALLKSICGDQPKLMDFNCDAVGPDLSLSDEGETGETNPVDIVGSAFYDAYTESFYYTLTSSTADSSPFGLVRLPRGSDPRTSTPAPSGFSNSVVNAWYLGRHDVLVMQDPDSLTRFAIGTWGLATDSTEWEYHVPNANYATAMSKWHLDEQHGILHSLHDDGATVYVMRWTLLTGRIERLDTAIGTGATFKGFLYSPDMDAYLIATDARLYWINPRTGTTIYDTTGIDTSGCLGLCVSGDLVGVISDGSITYYDRVQEDTVGPWGTTGGTINTVGDLGGIVAIAQNTYTNHVTLAKTIDGTAGFVNFLPSVVQDIDDLSAQGTPSTIYPNTGTSQFEVTSLPDTTTTSGWTRDWSKRTYTAYDMRRLEGRSSLAAAMYAVCANVASLDSARWGAGLATSFFDISSFEHVHGYCVGGVLMPRPPEIFYGSGSEGSWGPASGSGVSALPYYAERAKFDFVLEGETDVSSLLSDAMLSTINGYRRMVNGKLCVGVTKPGQFPQWHFTDDNVSKPILSFLGRSDGVNRVRVQYIHILDEYKQDFAEDNDDFDQDARGRVQSRTINLSGIARYGQAMWLAKQLNDSIGALRRQVEFDVPFVGYMVQPGDPIEISSTALGLDRMLAIVQSINETEAGSMHIEAVEHKPISGGVKFSNHELSRGGDSDTDDGDDPDCVSAEAPTDDSVAWFNGGGAFAPGDYTISYVGGAYKPSGIWDFAVAGFDLVCRDATTGAITILLSAPAVSIAAPGWASQAAAESANDGQSAAFTLAEGTPLGLRRAVGGIALAIDNTPMPIYQICLPATTGSGSGSVAPQTCPTDCSDCPCYDVEISLPALEVDYSIDGGAPTRLQYTAAGNTTWLHVDLRTGCNYVTPVDPFDPSLVSADANTWGDPPPNDGYTGRSAQDVPFVQMLCLGDQWKIVLGEDYPGDLGYATAPNTTGRPPTDPSAWTFTMASSWDIETIDHAYHWDLIWASGTPAITITPITCP